MKTYTFLQLKNLVKEQGYKMAALQNQQGDRIVPFNPYKKSISNLDSQFKVIQTRLKSEHLPDGVYFVLLSHNINAARNPDPFAIIKGKVDPDQLAEAEKKTAAITPTITMFESKRDSVLTLDKFFEMQKEISDLKADNARLSLELTAAHKEIADYEDEEDLSEEGPQSHMLTFLKEAMPMMGPLADRYFNLEEKKLDLEKLKINGAGSTAKKQQVKRKEIIPGSQDHLNLIEHYYNSEDPNAEEKLNAELDKLQLANPELYEAVISKLEMDQEDGSEESEEENES